MRKGIILGTGILIILLALAGTGSAHSAYGFATAGCNYCHNGVGPWPGSNATYFKSIHEFDGNSEPSTSNSCTHCHVDPTNANFSLISNGSFYNSTHRYNATTLASVKLIGTGCINCHVNASYNNFTLLTGTPSYLTSSVCEDCHKAKHDNWTNTMHRVMLTDNITAQAMNLPTPEVGWANISYVIVTKFQFDYINLTGYFLSQNDSYETETKEFANSSHAGGAYGTCGKCHTTGWNTSGWNASLLNGLLPGINGTFSEPGIACERCHKPAGNGHQVVVNYSGDLCRECHTGKSHGTGWESGSHAPPPYENGSNCVFCHSPFDKYKNENVTKDKAAGVSCGVCHNIHDMTDNKYAETFKAGNFNETIWSQVADSKLSFFNATASIAAGTDIFDDLTNILLYPGNDTSRKDSSYGTAPINLTGRPTSEVLCSMCHYRHGIAHMPGINLTHGVEGERATCTDCHMGGANASVGKDMMKNHNNDPLTANSCGGPGKCHSSMQPLINEWKGSAHNDKEVGVNKSRNYNGFYWNSTSGAPNSRQVSCNKCHSPKDWNPAKDSDTTNVPLTSAFNGITCGVCHNLHDMGDWLTKTEAAFGAAKPYAWYNKDAILSGTRYKANYTMMESTTELCGNCHSNIRIGNEGPGWASATASNPISPHGFPAKDLFVGSVKEAGLLKFECTSCHFAKMTRDENGTKLPVSQMVKGHSFKVNATILMNGTACSTCHVTGSTLGNLSTTIENIQAETHDKWNATNSSVMAALDKYKKYPGVKGSSADKIARAYWNLKLVSSDESWGVHNPAATKTLLDDAATLATASNDSLGLGLVSNVELKAGWNDVALKGTPKINSTISVMSSVSSNITIVWGYNTSKPTKWEFYDPTISNSLNSLKTIVPGQGYWIYATKDCTWTV